MEPLSFVAFPFNFSFKWASLALGAKKLVARKILAIVSGVALPSAYGHIYDCFPVHNADVDGKGDEIDDKDDDNDDDQGVTTWGLSSLASFLKILSLKRICCVFRDKNTVNQGFWEQNSCF